MTFSLTRSELSRKDANPALLLQANPAAASGPNSFGAALERARQAERPAEKPANTAQQRPSGQDRPRSSEHSPSRSEPAAKAPEDSRPHTAAATEAPAEEGRAGDHEGEAAESPAGTPAEIAALIAALASGKPLQAEGESAADPEAEAAEAADVLNLNKRGSGQQNAGQGLLPHTKADAQSDADAGEARTPAPLRANAAPAGTEAQLPTTATEENPAEGPRAQQASQPANPLFAAARAESLRPVQPPQLPVISPPSGRAWAAEVGNQVVWMLNRNESKAELVLTPSSLGKLGVSIQMNGEQTSAHFVAATQAAREALEHAMPRLREMLQQAGIQLGQANVSTSGEQHHAQEGQHEGARRANGLHGEGDGNHGRQTSASGLAEPAPRPRIGNGVIDTFA